MGLKKNHKMASKVQKEFPGASAYRDRHGVRRWRYRKGSFSTELGTKYGSPEFVRRYEEALLGLKSPAGETRRKALKGTVAGLVDSWYESLEFLSLAKSTQRVYRGVLDPFRTKHGTKPVAKMRLRHVNAILAEKAETPSAASNLRKRLAQLFDHAVAIELREDNPVRATKAKKISTRGFHTWSESEIAKFFECHEPGTLAHTTVTLMLHTGAARVDAVQLGPFNIKESRLTYYRQKTAGQGGVEVTMPLHPDLAKVLKKLPKDRPFLATRKGSVRSSDSLGNMMRQWCDKAGLPECTAHGLRKACARRLAEAGATTHEIMSVTGHKTLSLVELYTKEAERKAMADSAVSKLASSSNEEQNMVNLDARFAKQPHNPLKGRE